MTAKKDRKSLERPLHPEPDMEEGMGADYQGLYQKTFFASSMTGDYRSKSTIARKQHQFISREDDNMLGKLEAYESSILNIPSPTKFEIQLDRDPFGKKGVFGPQLLNENRFLKVDRDVNEHNSKYMTTTNSPNLKKRGWNYTLDEFIKNDSSIANENAT